METFIDYFENGLRCKIHQHGASCAVDSLIELFYFSIFRFSNYDFSCSHEALIRNLFEISKLRCQNQRVTCVMRDIIWDWLESNLGCSYQPRGEGKDQVIAGLSAVVGQMGGLASHSICCLSCERSYQGSQCLITYDSNKSSNGVLGQAVQFELLKSASYVLRACSSVCPDERDCLFIMPDFLCVEIPLVNAKNMQNPALVIHEEIVIFSATYFLTGSVCMIPGHFFTISRYYGGFIVLDGLAQNVRDSLKVFPTFASAVKGDLSATEKYHKTSDGRIGVAFLVYRYMAGGRKFSRQIKVAHKRRKPLGEIPSSEQKPKEATFAGIAKRSAKILNSPSYEEPVDMSSCGKSFESSLDSQPLSVPSFLLGNPTQTGTQRFGKENDPMSQSKSVPSVLNTDTTQSNSPSFCKENMPAHLPKPVPSFLHANTTQNSSQRFSKESVLHQTISKPSVLQANITQNGTQNNCEGNCKMQPCNCSGTQLKCQLNSPVAEKKEVSTSIDYDQPKGKAEMQNSEVGKSSGKEHVKKSTLTSATDNKIPVKKVEMNPELKKSSSGEKSRKYPLSGEHVTPKRKFSEEKAKCGELKIFSVYVPYIFENSKLYLSCRMILNLAGMKKHLDKEGYRLVDERLVGQGFSIQDHFIFHTFSKHRKYISFNALMALLNSKGRRWKEWDSLKKELDKLLLSEFTINLGRPLSRKHSKHNPQSKPITKKTFQQKLKEICKEAPEQGTRQDVLNAFSKIIKPSSKRRDVLNKHDVLGILKKSTPSMKSKEKYSNFLEEIAGPSLSTEDLIHFEENYSGTRLMEELRKKMPLQIPSQRQERKQKHIYNLEFNAVLLPERTFSGWRIDPHRLTELLAFQNYWLSSKVFWRLYGDGREIGGRPSTYISLSVLNNEAVLHGKRFQSPKGVYPLAIFYEGDSRQNLELNLGYRLTGEAWLDNFIARKVNGGSDTFFLTGDEMFLESMLDDGTYGLSPTSDDGWCIYSKRKKISREETSQDHFRLPLGISVDREHPNAILKSIPTCQVVLCLLHCVARSVEKLLTLEVENIISEANKSAVSGVREKLLGNLVSNINARGVRQGKFEIHIEKNGACKPIKLNKDHAMTILSPSPSGMEAEFPHVLYNVCEESTYTNTLPSNVKEKLSLKSQYTAFELVSQIWYHFHEMITILKKDPEPVVLDGKAEGSLDARDYSWGYSEKDIDDYKYHAESFYQLFVFRYSASHLTPYMMKLVDLGSVLMQSLPFSLARFQSEAGEHANYDHNRFFYQHTTRAGGHSHNNEPLLSILCNMYKQISYNILHGDQSTEGKQAAEAFCRYKKMHVSASSIQKWWRALKGKPVGNKMCSTTRNFHSELPGVFSGKEFVLCGAVPKFQGKSMNHASLRTIIHEHGGRVHKSMPLPEKILSNDKYIVLVPKSVANSKELPDVVRRALRAKCLVLDYSYIYDTVLGNCNKGVLSYKVDLSYHTTNLSETVSVEKKYFSKTPNMISVLKKRRKKMKKKVFKKSPKKGNPGNYFVWKNMRRVRSKSFFRNSQL
ncbi:hypothetical protein HOLleu_03862 [Holothuria leucospilota]|uniref:BRCT domain-containing protein n=1 Tax=Holothuria leucospilota TaxID=206669 RepID=A0A9Q1CU27_HOLLE|nr:hypothetical protein HOLleu_03862 [Holothuria leucospilota]